VQNSSKLKQLLWLEEPTSLAASLAETQLARASISVLPPLDTSHVSEYDPRTDRALHVGDVRPDTLALIMFTSGSTSAPKPVPFSHAKLLWSLKYNQQQRLHFHEALLVPGAGTLSFLPNFHVIGFINNFLSVPPHAPSASITLTSTLTSNSLASILTSTALASVLGPRTRLRPGLKPLLCPHTALLPSHAARRVSCTTEHLLWASLRGPPKRKLHPPHAAGAS
jgi:long-subunit acyl-CoA synthetase (AMP-forming)